MKIQPTMKGLFTCILVAITLAVSAVDVKSPLMEADTVVWAGVDYSQARLIGPDDVSVPYNFRIPPGILIPGMFDEWNELFIKERLAAVTEALGKQVLIDVNGVAQRNRTFTTNQIVLLSKVGDVVGDLNISQPQIADAVRSLKLDRTNGLGLVFIVDKMVRRGTSASPGL